MAIVRFYHEIIDFTKPLEVKLLSDEVGLIKGQQKIATFSVYSSKNL